jgi:hypothetical protein
MRRTRHTVLTAVILLAGCATDDNRLGGNNALEPGPDAGAGSGGAAGSGSSGAAAGSSGTGNPTGGSSGTSGADLGPPSDTYTAFVDQIITFDDPAAPTPGKCMPRRLQVGADGNVPCVIAQATFQAPDCGCAAPGFSPAPASLVAVVRERLQAIRLCGGDTGKACESYCVCEMAQFTGAERDQCQTSPTLALPEAGWCYIDVDQGGDPSQVVACPASQKRKLRFNDPFSEPGRMNFIACADRTTSPSLGPARSGAIGAACIPSGEAVATFSGFANTEVSVEIGSRQCSSGLCLANHFKGRVTCPYGQSATDPTDCLLPGSGDPVQVQVEPQDSMRRSTESVYCSCRCAGPGPGPFCACPQGFRCTELVDDIGLAGSSTIAGSYCIKDGTDFDWRSGIECNRTQMNCE